VTERERLFRQWYQEQAPAVRRYLFLLAGASHVDDLVQETFLRVWRHMDSFEDRSTVKTWIHRIATNTAMDRFRKAGPDKLAVELEVSETELTAPETPYELKDLVRKGLESLSETLSAAFVLHYLQDFSVSEIAQILEIPEGTVKTRLYHGREKMIEFFRQNGVDNDF